MTGIRYHVVPFYCNHDVSRCRWNYSSTFFNHLSIIESRPSAKQTTRGSAARFGPHWAIRLFLLAASKAGGLVLGHDFSCIETSQNHPFSCNTPLIKNQEYSVFFWWVVRFRNNSLTCFCPCWCFWNSTSYWCLAEIGLEWGNGMIIDSDYGSFPHSLLSTSKACLFPNCQFKLHHGATPPALTTCHCPILSRWLGDIPIAGQTRVNFVSPKNVFHYEIPKKCVPL